MAEEDYDFGKTRTWMDDEPFGESVSVVPELVVEWDEPYPILFDPEGYVLLFDKNPAGYVW